MRVPQFRGTCSICGGGGVSSGSDMSANWQGAALTHADPNICARILKTKRDVANQRADDKAARGRAQFDADDEYMFEQMDEANENN